MPPQAVVRRRPLWVRISLVAILLILLAVAGFCWHPFYVLQAGARLWLRLHGVRSEFAQARPYRIHYLTAGSGQPVILKERFVRRISELLADRANLEERIVQEAAVMAAKADVREELDRLASHVAAARTLMAGEGAAGRKLDFLNQEFMREANTLCSKSATTALTAIGLELKATIDQFREQVQNVE